MNAAQPIPYDPGKPRRDGHPLQRGVFGNDLLAGSRIRPAGHARFRLADQQGIIHGQAQKHVVDGRTGRQTSFDHGHIMPLDIPQYALHVVPAVWSRVTIHFYDASVQQTSLFLFLLHGSPFSEKIPA
jgi:hypothetical protein